MAVLLENLKSQLVSTGFHKEISNSRITTVKMEEQEPRLEMGSDSNF